MKEFSEVVKGSISEEDLSRARYDSRSLMLFIEMTCSSLACRNQLKASYMMSSEIQDTLLEDVGMQVLVNKCLLRSHH